MRAKSMIKKRKSLLTLFISGLIATQAQAEVQPLDRVIAIAENDVVLESELHERLELIYQGLIENNTTPPPRDVLAKQVLDRLIVDNLQLQRGKRAGVRINDNELNEAIGNIARQNGMTLEQFKLALEEDGMSYFKTREKVREEMIINRVQQGHINSRIKVTEQEVDNFLQSEEGKFHTSADYRLAHIMLAFPVGARAEDIQAVEEKAQAIYLEIQNGGNFQQIAAAKSDGQNALQGGDLGWRKTSQLPSLFAKVAPQMKVGDISQPIRSGGGFHLIKLINKRGGNEQVVHQTQARHILLKANEIRDEAAVKALITKLRQDILNGADFAALAKEHSEDHGSASAGGDLGWMMPGQLVPAFQKVMDTSPVGQVSEPFRSAYGWHILEVLGRRDEDMSEKYVRSRAQNIIHRRKFNDELQNWLREIRDEAFVDIKLGSEQKSTLQ